MILRTERVHGGEQQGLILVLCAPSGTGKSTLVKRLLAEFPRFQFSVSCTTRKPRSGERDGVDYNFLSKETFLSMKEAGEFAEWAEVHGNFYGTPRGPVQDLLNQGKDVIFDIDVQGATQLRQSFPEGLYIFLLPPSRIELERRLRGRETDSEEAIARRLGNAAAELAEARHFDYWIVNDDLELAYDDLRAVYLAGRKKPVFRPTLLQTILRTFQ
ncbi:MAG: guanylate kinase [Proteobacteria bacterium]|nr:guanylate kinase [Pseudomonadota bacterium]